ncbi:hypothetical protein TREMEDRAFT_66202 [Tremella mesenterica DSM 1558]|uniref:uncharacterized protein n=1 Tax=Tremella mesenterica (strain ATCC 24925 / CBS 8224 / DSM 1558 / NBRC 9311 / NRRL Y-6157 / RJB 2259-6 / UBC 559-6) TaxID=578456 RepID=UPI00032C4CAA|nr:uncharacterized protein TREMEDRAFT_66202 [Tremella mesenterica DSM 1558]EIW65834.1 hypothetical protein TREMEDRAFT_66202 [Tremella mesenterica DSM 1558]
MARHTPRRAPSVVEAGHGAFPANLVLNRLLFSTAPHPHPPSPTPSNDKDPVHSVQSTTDLKNGSIRPASLIFDEHAPPATEPSSEYDGWVARYHDTPDHRLVGNLVDEFGGEQDDSDAASDAPSPQGTYRTPNVRITKDFLRPMKLKLSREDGYIRKEVKISDLIRHFELLPHDYNLRRHSLYREASIKWIDGVGLFPSEIRARRMEISVPKAVVRHSGTRLVWRVVYACNGACETDLDNSARHNVPTLGAQETLDSQLFSFAKRAAKNFNPASKNPTSKVQVPVRTQPQPLSPHVPKLERLRSSKRRSERLEKRGQIEGGGRRQTPTHGLVSGKRAPVRAPSWADGSSNKTDTDSRSYVDNSSDHASIQSHSEVLHRQNGHRELVKNSRHQVDLKDDNNKNKSDNYKETMARRDGKRVKYDSVNSQEEDGEEEDGEEEDGEEEDGEEEDGEEEDGEEEDGEEEDGEEENREEEDGQEEDREGEDVQGEDGEEEEAGHKEYLEEADSEDDYSEDDYSDEEFSGDEQEPGDISDKAPEGSPKRYKSHFCGTFIVVEMTAAQCEKQRCTIIEKDLESHPPVRSTSELRISPYMRRLLHEAALGFGMTVGRLQAWYAKDIMSNDTHALWLSQQCPHRLPKASDYRTAVSTATAVSRLDRSPLAAMEIIYKQHPQSFLAAHFPNLLEETPGKRVDPSTRFECVIAPRYAQMCAILQVGQMGMYLDSSWRNKNAFRCPLTFLVTINEYHRMIPLAAMVSNHNDVQAYRFLLAEFKKAVRQTAGDYLLGKFEIKIDGVSQDILQKACLIVSEDGLIPRFVMIDGCDAERLAIEFEFPGVPLRAYLRFGGFWGPTFGLQSIQTQSWKLYKHVNDVQRRKIGTNTMGFLKIPQVTRDGPWSTNNYSEAAFRTFDRVFLNCRANKRRPSRRGKEGRAVCTCGYGKHSGKRCGHLWAMVMYELCGPIGEFEANHALIEDIILGTMSNGPTQTVSSTNQNKDDPFYNDRNDYKEYWGRDVIRSVKWSHIDINPGYTPQQSIHTSQDISKPVTQPIVNSPYVQTSLSDPINTTTTTKPLVIPRRHSLTSADQPPPGVRGVTLHHHLIGVGESPGRHIKELTHPVQQQKRKRREIEKVEGVPVSNQEAKRIRSNQLPVAFKSGKHTPDDHLPSTAPPSQGYSHHQQPTSPIGRRYSRIRDKVNDYSSAVDDHNSDPSTWSHSLPGRPAAIRPLQPYRHAIPSAQKSKLRMPRKVVTHLDSIKPTGVRNTGIDCYAIALFQVLLRLVSWSAELERFRLAVPPLADPVFSLLFEFRMAVETHLSTSFPQLRTILAGHFVVSSATQMMDPDEVLRQLNTYLDGISSTNLFSRLFEMVIMSVGVCPVCQAPSTGPTEPSVAVHNSLFLHPWSPQGKQKPFDQMLKESYQTSTKANYQCKNIVCSARYAPQGQGFNVTPSTFFTQTPVVLRLNIVWNSETSPEGLKSSTVQTVPRNNVEQKVHIGDPFHIPLDLVLPEGVNVNTIQIKYQLRGIVCRHGEAVEVGHYVAITRGEEDTWWILDDDKVTLASNPSAAAFQDARYPVILFYESTHHELSTSTSTNMPRPEQLNPQPQPVASTSSGISKRNEATGPPPVPVGRTPSNPPPIASPAHDRLLQQRRSSHSTAGQGLSLASSSSSEIHTRADMVEPKYSREASDTRRITPVPLSKSSTIPQSQPPMVKASITQSQLPSSFSTQPSASRINEVAGLTINPTRHTTYPSHTIGHDSNQPKHNMGNVRNMGAANISLNRASSVVGPATVNPQVWIADNLSSGKEAASQQHLPTHLTSHSIDIEASKDSIYHNPHPVPFNDTEDPFRWLQLDEEKDMFDDVLPSDMPSPPTAALHINHPTHTSAVSTTTSQQEPSASVPSVINNISTSLKAPVEAGSSRHVITSVTEELSGIQELPPNSPIDFPLPSPKSPLMAVIDPEDMKSVPFDSLKDVRDQENAALRRYYKLIWVGDLDGKTSPMANFITMSDPRQFAPAPIPFTDRFFNRLLSRMANQGDQPGLVTRNGEGTIVTGVPHVTVTQDGVRRLKNRTSWWNDHLIDSLCLQALARTNRQSPPVGGRCRVAYLFSAIEEVRGVKPAGKKPWRILGKDSSWRDYITVGVVSVQRNTHFAALAIFGPARLVIVYDSAGGTFDDRIMKEKWTTLLKQRLTFEYHAGMVTAEQNENWIFAPNTPRMRDHLHWVTQTDGHNCGPLATAAIFSIIQGIRPDTAHLGLVTTTYTPACAVVLRDSFTYFLLSEVALSMTDEERQGEHLLRDKLLMDEMQQWGQNRLTFQLTQWIRYWRHFVNQKK